MQPKRRTGHRIFKLMVLKDPLARRKHKAYLMMLKGPQAQFMANTVHIANAMKRRHRLVR